MVDHRVNLFFFTLTVLSAMISDNMLENQDLEGQVHSIPVTEANNCFYFQELSSSMYPCICIRHQNKPIKHNIMTTNKWSEHHRLALYRKTRAILGNKLTICPQTKCDKKILKMGFHEDFSEFERVPDTEAISSVFLWWAAVVLHSNLHVWNKHTC